MAVEKPCYDCGAKFLCGTVGEKQCWCYYQPHVLPYYAGDGDCVCPACFERRVARAKAEQVQKAGPDGGTPPAAPKRVS